MVAVATGEMAPVLNNSQMALEGGQSLPTPLPTSAAPTFRLMGCSADYFLSCFPLSGPTG